MIYTQEQLEGMSDYELEVKIHILNGGLDNKDPTPKYCSDWEVMGPLIDGSNISLDISDDATAAIFDNKYCRIDKRTLRAAAIVYILVMQQES